MGLLSSIGQSIISAKKALGLGGLNLFPGDVSKATTGVPASAMYYGASSSAKGSGLINPAGPYNPPSKINPYVAPTPAGQVKGLSTAYNPAPQVPTPQQQNIYNPFQGQENAAGDQYNADISAEEALYGRNRELLEQQKAQSYAEEETALAKGQQGLSEYKQSAEEKKKESGKLTERAIGEAGSLARNTQRETRNILRSLGILGSSYAVDKLSAPISEFGTERNRLVGLNVENLNKIDQEIGTQEKKHLDWTKELQQNFINLRNQINADIRFNDSDKLAALKAANAAYTQRLADIRTSLTNFVSQADAQKQNFVAQIAQIQLQQNPSANLQGILSSAMNIGNQVYSPQTASMALTEEQRKRLYG